LVQPATPPPQQQTPPQQQQQPPPSSWTCYGDACGQQQGSERFEAQACYGSAGYGYGGGGASYQGGGGGYPSGGWQGKGYGGRGGGYSGGFNGGGNWQGKGGEQFHSRFGGGGDGKGGSEGGKGKGKGAPKDPEAPTRFYPVREIIATGLIVPKDTKIYWDNPARADGMYGKDCPLCGPKDREQSWDDFVKEHGKPPGLGYGKHPQPTDLAIPHRGIGCKEFEWKVGRYVREHEDAPACMKRYMKEKELAALKEDRGS